MAELFRYIQHAFVAPLGTQAIDAGRRSDLQNSLRDATSSDQPPDRLRNIAHAFIAKHFPSPRDDPFQLRRQLLAASEQLAPPSPDTDAIEELIETIFDSDAADLVGSDAFQADKALLDDILVCVKVTTGFDRVNAHELVTMRQAIAFIEDFAAGRIADDTEEGIRATLRRPIRIPSEFVKPVTLSAESLPSLPPSEPPDDSAARQRDALMDEQRHLKRAYETIMGLPPDQFELKPMSIRAERETARKAAGRAPRKDVSAGEGAVGEDEAGSAAPSFLSISETVIERLGADVRATLESANIDVAGAPVSSVIAAIKRHWQDVSRQLAPYQVPTPTRVFRLGAHLFAVQDSAAPRAAARREAL